MKVASLAVGLMAVCALISSPRLEAKTAESFTKRFNIVRSQDGKLMAIKDRTLPVRFSVVPYVNMIKKHLQHEQSLLNSPNFNEESYEDEIKSLLSEGQGFEALSTADQRNYEANVKRVVESLKKLSTLNVEGIFNNPTFVNVISKYDEKMTNALMQLDPTVLANVQDSSFFYKKNVTYQVVEWGLGLARKSFSNIAFLNTASYVIVQVENLITERRNFRQNMLLHYLENFKPEELGLTHDEVNLVWSSIYESRIPWFAFWESSSAKNNWNKYGVNNFYFNYRAATTKFRNASVLYSDSGSRLNYGFQRVTYNNEDVVINLFDNESMFQKKPAIAYNFSKPTQVVRKRIVLNLASLGLSFVPMGAFFKDIADNFIKSFYVNQKITEGALYGYFESMGDTEQMEVLKAQYLNPFDTQL